MATYEFYRLCIWLPIVVPTVLILVYGMFGLRISDGIVAEMVAYSLLYGGLPYAALALWGTWWVRGRPEDEIKRLMLRAPLLMVAVFVALALTVGLVVGNLRPYIGVALLGAAVILPLGYSYVGLALLLRRALGPRRT
jgi:hypothetical protein